jgi:hypothetical protein
MDESPRELAATESKSVIVSPNSCPLAVPAAVSAPAELPIPASKSARGATTTAGTSTRPWEIAAKTESEKGEEHCQ